MEVLTLDAIIEDVYKQTMTIEELQATPFWVDAEKHLIRAVLSYVFAEYKDLSWRESVAQTFKLISQVGVPNENGYTYLDSKIIEAAEKYRDQQQPTGEIKCSFYKEYMLFLNSTFNVKQSIIVSSLARLQTYAEKNGIVLI